MTPAQFERLVAKRLESEGCKTRLTPSTNDWGVDIFADRGVERLAEVPAFEDLVIDGKSTIRLRTQGDG